MEPTTTAPLSTRACRSCAAAKTKCVAATGRDCERCHRLKRVCVRDAPSQRKRKPPTAKNTRLEEKLDQLVTLLANGHHQSSSSPTPDAPRKTPAIVNTTEAAPETHVRARPQSPTIAGEAGAFTARPQEHQYDPSDLNPEDADLARCLGHYQTYMAKYFPFVVVPPGTTVSALRDTKPFLLKVIVAVASTRDLARQRALGTDVVSYLGTNLLGRGERSVDLLQGLLVFLAWYHPHFFINPQMTNLLQLAVGLVIDLGLKRSARSYGSERLESAITRSAHGELANSELRTSDERRALLGCFYLTTILAQWAKRYDSLRYNAQLDEICQYLDEAQEYVSDRYLVHLVRLQRIVQRIERKVPIDDFTSETSIPIAMFVKALHTELVNFKKQLPEDLAQNTFMLLHYCNAEIYLYEISLSSLPTTAQYADYTYRRLEMLNACMHTAKDLISYYHQIPSSVYFNLPFIHFSQLTCTTIALSKLTRLDCPGWDRAYAQAYIDFAVVMDQTAMRYEEARSSAEVPVADNPLFSFFARKLRFIKAWNEAKLKGLEHQPPPRNIDMMNFGGDDRAGAGGGDGCGGGGGGGGPSGEPMQLADISQDDLFDQLDISFWQSLTQDPNWDINMGACWPGDGTTATFPGQ